MKHTKIYTRLVLRNFLMGHLLILAASHTYSQCNSFLMGAETCWYPYTLCVNTSGYALIDVKAGYTYEFTTCMDVMYEGFAYSSYDQNGNYFSIKVNQFPSQLIIEEDATAIPILSEHRGRVCNGNYNTAEVAWTAYFTGKIRVYVQEYPNKRPTSHPKSDCVAAFAYRISGYPDTVQPNLLSWFVPDAKKTGSKSLVPPFYGVIDIGQPGKVEFSVINTGNAVSQPTKTGIYISKDGILDASDKLVKTVIIPPLGVGEFHEVSTTFPTDASLLAHTNSFGQIQIIMRADDWQEISESNENDNAIMKATGVSLHTPSTPGTPDYSASFGSVGFHYQNLKRLEMAVQVKNIGPGDVAAMVTDYHLYYSNDATLSNNDISMETYAGHSLAFYNLGPLGLNQSVSIYFDIADWTRFASSNESGYFIFVADDVNRIVEVNEQNNISIQSITFPDLYTIPDLGPMYPTQPLEEVLKSEMFMYEVRVLNVGETEVPIPTIARLFFSTDDVLDEEDLPIGEVPVDPIASGMEFAMEIAAMLPPEVEAGPGFLMLEVDSDQEIVESDEENNVLAMEVTVVEAYGEEMRKGRVESATLGMALQIYPNPGRGLFFAEMPIDEAADFDRLAVFDSMGKMVYQFPLSGEGKWQINLSGKAAGMYVVKWSGATKQVSRRILLLP